MGGFDTHAKQVYTQKKLLKVYSDALETFVSDLEQSDTFKDTLIVTFSEFGRRVKQNAANGTDHGAANQVFVIGKNLKKAGMFNASPNLLDLDTNGDLQYSVDFRQIYASLIDDWLEGNHEAILHKRFNKLKMI